MTSPSPAPAHKHTHTYAHAHTQTSSNILPDSAQMGAQPSQLGRARRTHGRPVGRPQPRLGEGGPLDEGGQSWLVLP